jgi:cytidine deaminase
MVYLVRRIITADAAVEETTVFAEQKITAEDAAIGEMMSAGQKTAEGITETAAGSGNRTKGYAL